MTRSADQDTPSKCQGWSDSQLIGVIVEQIHRPCHLKKSSTHGKVSRGKEIAAGDFIITIRHMGDKAGIFKLLFIMMGYLHHVNRDLGKTSKRLYITWDGPDMRFLGHSHYMDQFPKTSHPSCHVWSIANLIVPFCNDLHGQPLKQHELLFFPPSAKNINACIKDAFYGFREKTVNHFKLMSLRN